MLSPSRVWRQLQSMTFAIIMLSVILLVIVVGSFLPQDNGIRLVYHSWWFYGLNFVLMASVLSCCSRRIRTVVRFAFRVPVVHRGEFYRAGDTATELGTGLPADLATQRVVKALRSQHYRVAVEEHDGAGYVLADRFRVFRLGTLVSHYSIVLLVATIVWGAFAGWLDQGTLLEAGGGAVAIGHGTDLKIRSDSFDFGLYPNGTPSNFHDHLTLIEPDGTERHQVIDVNTPWYYGGVFGYDIHQASYGMTAYLIALDARSGKPTPLPYCVIQFGGEDCNQASLLLEPLGDGSYNPVGGGFAAFYLPRQNIAVSLTYHDPVPMARLPATVVMDVAQPPAPGSKSGMQVLASQADMTISPHRFGGRLEKVTGTPLTVKGVRLAVLVRRVTSINIGHNPAVPFIFASFVLIILGLIGVLYFPFSRLWLNVAPTADGQGSVVLMRGSSEKSKHGFKRRFTELARAVERELGRERGDLRELHRRSDA